MLSLNLLLTFNYAIYMVWQLKSTKQPILIGLVSPQYQIRQEVRALLVDHHEFSVSAFAWHDFVSCPLEKQQSALVLSFVEERIVPIDREIA